MYLQALLLCLIILVSFLISPVRNYISNGVGGTNLSSAQSPELITSAQKPATSFWKDLYSVLREKTAEEMSTVSQNIASAKQALFAGTNEIFSKPNSENSFPDLPPAPSQIALISEAKPDFPVPFCHLEQPVFNSQAILVKYLDYNFNVFELNPENRRPIASLSKLMTGVIALEKIGPDKKIVIDEKAVATEGTSGNFKAGEVFSAADLIKAMLVASSNDAAMAIAENFGKAELSSDEENFINEMQKKAAELKMFKTSFLEPTGLSFINQSTITDLVKLVNYIYKNHPELLEISRQKEVEVLELNSGKLKKILNVDKFAGEPDFLGGKTGYIEEAGRNLIALFNINGKTVLMIILGADDSFKEAERLKDLIKNCQ